MTECISDIFPEFGFSKGEKRRVVVAMSGGVDSSVVAALAHAAGHEVIGITLQLYDHGEAVGRKGSCCAGADIHDARTVADRLGIAHYVMDYESAFRQEVIDDFVDSYAQGKTPIPCVRCNQTVKFRDLWKLAKDLGADCMATGHYVRRIQTDQGTQLHRAHDVDRDQSYFLFATTAQQLAFLRFPLGGLPKSRVRALANHFHLQVADKPDSQDICFVPDRDYASLVRKLRPEAGTPGDIVDLSGKVIGHHPGLIHYTVGQRRGLDIGGMPEPLYVIRLDLDNQRLVVGPESALGVSALSLNMVNWLGHDIPKEGMPVRVKIRSTCQPVSARWLPQGRVVFDTPEKAVSPGQACVAYLQDRVLGGGWISHTENTAGCDSA